MKLLALTTALFLISAPAFADIKVSDVHAFETSEGMKNGAVLLTIENTGNDEDKLVSAQTPVTGDVQIHEMAETNGVMKMRQVDGVTVQAHHKKALSPDGYHIMLMNLNAPLKAGETHPIVLKFEKAGDVKTDFEVQPRLAKKNVMIGGDHKGHEGH